MTDNFPEEKLGWYEVYESQSVRGAGGYYSVKIAYIELTEGTDGCIHETAYSQSGTVLRRTNLSEDKGVLSDVLTDTDRWEKLDYRPIE